MTRDHVVFLRGISNVPMGPYRAALLGLGLAEVDSFGGTGNLVGPAGEPPVASGASVYFVHPTRRPGRKGIVDFERELGLRGTMRASRVVARVLDKM